MKQEIKLFPNVFTSVLEHHSCKNNCMKAFHSLGCLEQILAYFVTFNTWSVKYFFFNVSSLMEIKTVFTTSVQREKRHFSVLPLFSPKKICSYPLQNKETVNTSWFLFGFPVRMQEEGQVNTQFLQYSIFYLSGDVRHHYFSFKVYSIGAFSLTEPVEKDTDKLLKQKEMHRDLTV